MDVARGHSSCGTRALLSRRAWDLPGPGIEPVFHALAGGFLTTEPPGKPQRILHVTDIEMNGKVAGVWRNGRSGEGVKGKDPPVQPTQGLHELSSKVSPFPWTGRKQR